MTARLDELGQAELAVRMRLAHDRGVLNESAFLDVLQELNAGHPLTFEHLAWMFGLGPAVHATTIPDETARQLVREAAELLTNADCQLDIRDWVRAAEHLVGPITFQQAVDIEAVSETSETRGPRP